MSVGKEVHAGETLPLPLPNVELAAGDRFPNFLLTDQDGKARWFLERAKGNPMLVFVDLSDTDITALSLVGDRFTAAGTDRLAIASGSNAEIAAKARRLRTDFPLLADTNGKIREALRRMAGVTGPAPFALALDANQRVLHVAQQTDIADWAISHLPAAAPAAIGPRVDQMAPVLIVPNVLSPELCRGLMDRWEQLGHEEGTVHSIVEGIEVTRTYDSMKRRRDHRIEDEAVLKPLMAVVGRRLAPELDKAFAFTKFKFDRFIVTCYEAERGDYFRRHRDNQSPSTADRRFALTLNLNTPDYEGGELVFPEYGPQRYSPPAGGAILFSCSLLHEALPVTKGRRFTLLSFLRQ